MPERLPRPAPCKPVLRRFALLLVLAGLLAVAAGCGDLRLPSGGGALLPPLPSSTPTLAPPTTPPAPASATPPPTARPTIPLPPRPSVAASPTRRLPGATETPPATLAPRPSSTPVDVYTIGGVRFADEKAPLTLRYPADLAGEGEVVVEGIDILVSDMDGSNLAYFSDIPSWLGAHKVFVYPDTASGRPIFSIHNGSWGSTPLEAEPLRRLLEGSVTAPLPEEEIEANLARLIGLPVVFEQGEARAEFVISQAIRMDAATTTDFLYRPGDLSTLLEPLEDPDTTLLWLMCSARQPGEPRETFPARFVLALHLAP